MKIELTFPGFLRIGTVKNGETIELAPGKTVTDLLDMYNIPPEHQRHIIPIVNREEKRLDYHLKDGDCLFLYVPVGGG